MLLSCRSEDAYLIFKTLRQLIVFSLQQLTFHFLVVPFIVVLYSNENTTVAQGHSYVQFFKTYG